MEVLVGFNCFITILIAITFGIIFIQLRSTVNKLRQQVDSLHQTVDRLSARRTTAPARPVQQVAPSAETLPTPPMQPKPVQPAPVQSPPPQPKSEPSRPTPAPVAVEGISKPDVPPTLPPTPQASPHPEPTPPPKIPASPLVTWFRNTNVLVQIGILILFIGVGFLLKYAADQGWFSLELRHIAAAVGGVVLSGLGWRLASRITRQGAANAETEQDPTLATRRWAYALALQGGGLGVIYLTTFSAFGIYELIPSVLAFAIFVILGVLCATLAIINNARILALLAIIGAFLAPILASDGGGSHIILFSYYAIINAGILAIAWFKAWRSLNLVGFFFTLGMGAAWGSAEYTPDKFATTEPFLILFFLFYLAIPILFALRQSDQTEAEDEQTPRPAYSYVDVSLLFGNPIAAILIQSELVSHIDFGLAYSTIGAAAIYLGLAVVFLRQNIERIKLLTECLLFWGLFFALFTVPLVFDPQITGAIWAVAGAGLAGMGSYRKQLWPKLKGLVVQFGAGIFMMQDIFELGAFDLLREVPVVNAIFISGMLLSVSGLVTAYFMQRESDEEAGESSVELSQLFSWLMLAWGLGWWFGTGLSQAFAFETVWWPDRYQVFNLILFATVSCALGEWLGRTGASRWQLDWSGIRFPMLLLLPFLMVMALIQLDISDHHFQNGGWLIWPLALVAHYWMLYGRDSDFVVMLQGDVGDSEDKEPPRQWLGLHHAGALWLVTFILLSITIQPLIAYLDAREYGDGWRGLPILGIPALIVLLVMRLRRRNAWPVRNHEITYQFFATGPLVLALIFFSMAGNAATDGNSSPLPYIPILNPMDIAQLIMLVAVWRWVQQLTVERARWIGILWAILVFITINYITARAVYQLSDSQDTWGNMLYASVILQTTYSIVWSVLALLLMFGAQFVTQVKAIASSNLVVRFLQRFTEGFIRTRHPQTAWFAGAVLLGLTVIKLFVVDLANAGTIARIVSFISVGLLILVVAYFAPIPPSGAETENG
ncbi:MAG: DUF2339 domain-containing protein [Chloroflexota bacterium]